MTSAGDGTTYACKCLNVQIQAQASDQSPPEDPCADTEFIPVFVGEVGVSITHPQVTLRTRSQGVPISRTKCTRYTSVTCLICQVLVYRVHQVFAVEVEGQDSQLLLPTHEWVEQEIMKSPSGWVEVHQKCLSGDALIQLKSSPSFSSIFSIILPSAMAPSPEPSGVILRAVPSTIPASPPSPHLFLSNMKPLFPPPPFTPVHPVFLHFSSIASAQSEKLRAAAEEEIGNVVREKVAAIEHAENDLKRDVKAAWKKFRESVGKYERDRSLSLGRANSATRGADHWVATDVGVVSPEHASVTVRDFIPSQSPVTRQRPANTVPRVSILSASLATTSFHHPHASSGQQASYSPSSVSHTDERNGHSMLSPNRRSSPGSSSSRTLSSPISSSSVTLQPHAESSNLIEPFKRNMDQTLDTAASYRYFTNLEAEIAISRAARQRTEQEKKPTAQQEPTLPTAEGSTSQVPETSGVATNGTRRSRKERRDSSTRISRSPSHQQGNDSDDSIASRGRQKEKGKRKVTFDVKPDVVTIKRELNSEKAEEAALINQGSGEMIFDLEEEGSERSFSEISPRPILPLIETTPARPPRPRTRNTGLPASLSSLRPASLPVPSHIRPPKSHHTTDISVPSLRMPRVPSKSIKEKEVAPPPEPGFEDPREAEILKLVAADTPSHRGAWKKDSKAWKMFVRRHDEKLDPSDADGDTIMEESEGDSPFGFGNVLEGEDEQSDSDGKPHALSLLQSVTSSNSPDTKETLSIVGSLPIIISPSKQPKQPLSLASYQPNTNLPDRSAEEPAVVNDSDSTNGDPISSSVAVRRAVYAERDRTRSMDPGALDFALEEDNEEDAANDDDPENGERGRKRALKILQARSQLPAAGMWRSLA